LSAPLNANERGSLTTCCVSTERTTRSGSSVPESDLRRRTAPMSMSVSVESCRAEILGEVAVEAKLISALPRRQPVDSKRPSGPVVSWRELCR